MLLRKLKNENLSRRVVARLRDVRKPRFSGFFGKPKNAKNQCFLLCYDFGVRDTRVGDTDLTGCLPFSPMKLLSLARARPNRHLQGTKSRWKTDMQKTGSHGSYGDYVASPAVTRRFYMTNRASRHVTGSRFYLALTSS